MCIQEREGFLAITFGGNLPLADGWEGGRVDSSFIWSAWRAKDVVQTSLQSQWVGFSPVIGY